MKFLQSFIIYNSLIISIDYFSIKGFDNYDRIAKNSFL